MNKIIILVYTCHNKVIITLLIVLLIAILMALFIPSISSSSILVVY